MGWNTVGLELSGSGTQCVWNTVGLEQSGLEHNGSGTQCVWNTVGLEHRGSGTQWVWNTVGLEHSGSGTQWVGTQCWNTMGLEHNGSGTQWVWNSTGMEHKEVKCHGLLQLSFLSCLADDKEAVLLYLLRDVIGADELTVVFAATKHHVEYLQLVSQTVPTFRNVVCDFFFVFCFSKSCGFLFYFKSLYSVSFVFCYHFVWYFELNMSHFHISSSW